MSIVNYESKYLKYKAKYEELKKLIGGGKPGTPEEIAEKLSASENANAAILPVKEIKDKLQEKNNASKKELDEAKKVLGNLNDSLQKLNGKNTLGANTRMPDNDTYQNMIASLKQLITEQEAVISQLKDAIKKNDAELEKANIDLKRLIEDANRAETAYLKAQGKPTTVFGKFKGLFKSK